MEDNNKKGYVDEILHSPYDDLSDIKFPPINPELLNDPVRDEKYLETLIYTIERWAGFKERDEEFEKTHKVSVFDESIDIAVAITTEAKHKQNHNTYGKPTDIALYPDIVKKHLKKLEDEKSALKNKQEDGEGFSPKKHLYKVI